MYYSLGGDTVTSLGQRIKIILDERKIKQVEFARTRGISANYVNQIVNGKKETISDTLSRLIEERYGYSAYWILTGNGEKLATNEISAEKEAIIKKILKMSDNEIKAVQAFINTLESMRDDSEEGGI